MSLPGWFHPFGSATKTKKLDDEPVQFLKYPGDFKHSLSRQTSNFKSNHPFFDEFSVLLYGMFIFGRFPFYRDSKGEIKHSAFSCASVYWLGIFSLQLFVAHDLLRDIIEVIFGEIKFDIALSHSRNALIIGNLLLLPVCFLREWKNLAHQINEFDRVLVCFRTMAGEDLKLGFKHSITALSVALLPFIWFITYLDNDSFRIKKVYHRAFYAALIIGITYFSFLWISFHVVIHRLADYICDKLVKIREKSRQRLPVTSSEVQMLRLLWIEASSLLQSSSQCMGMTMFFMTIINSACFVIAAYGCVAAVFTRNTNLLAHHILNIIGGFSYLLFATEAGYKSIQKVVDHTVTEISSIDVTCLNYSTTKEVQIFLQTLAVNRPTVTCAGIVNISRSYLATVMSNTITYLIVLIQFKSTDIEFSHNNTTVVTDANHI